MTIQNKQNAQSSLTNDDRKIPIESREVRIPTRGRSLPPYEPPIVYHRVVRKRHPSDRPILHTAENQRTDRGARPATFEGARPRNARTMCSVSQSKRCLPRRQRENRTSTSEEPHRDISLKKIKPAPTIRDVDAKPSVVTMAWLEQFSFEQ